MLQKASSYFFFLVRKGQEGKQVAFVLNCSFRLGWGDVRIFVFEARETFPRRRSALATNRATPWESRWSSYAMGLVKRSA